MFGTASADDYIAELANEVDKPDDDAQPQDPMEAEAPDTGYLLTCPEQEAAKTLIDWWKDGEKRRAKYNAVGLRNTAWRKGVRNVTVTQDADSGTWSVRYPLGGKSAPPQPNKLDDLLRGVVSAITADPVALEAEPQTDDENDRESAAFTSRVLKAECGESRLNVPAHAAEQLDMALGWASTFTLIDVDPAAGGQQPMAIEAFAHAQTVQDATTPLPPQVDPMTGQPLPMPEPVLVKRYVAEDGVTLTDDPGEAKRSFVPAIVLEKHSPATVQFLPPVVDSIDQAEGVLVGRVLTLGEVKRRMAETMQPLDDAAVQAIVDWRPPRAKTWLPPALEAYHASSKVPKQADGTIADHALVWVLTAFIRACPSYPKGATLHVLGEKYVNRSTFVLERPDGEEETLDLPVAHLMGLNDPEGDPMGRALADILGPADEVRGSILAMAQEYAWRFGRPIQYVPTGSTIKPIDLARRDGTPIPYNPEGGKPEFEPTPVFPPTMFELYDRMGGEMEQAAALPPPAQGYASANIKSGEHMQRVLEQSQQQLSDLHRHTADFCARLGRLIVQQMRAHYDVPRLLRFTTDEGGYEAKEWSKTDLGTTADIRIARGSFTMLPKTAKTALAQQELDMAIKTGDPLAIVRHRRTLAGNIAPMLGLEDDPHRRRILRQIAAWKDGTDESLTDPMTGQLVPVPPPMPSQQPVPGAVDPMTGGPILQTVMQPAPDPVTQRAASCFAPIPADEEPQVAQTRWYELSRVMATTAYESADPRWRAGLEQAYRAARQAAGVTTLAEQQQAQAQQQQAQQQAQQAEAQAKTAYAEQATAEAEAQRMEAAHVQQMMQGGNDPLARGF